jgi:hypothetical protein
MDDRKSELEKLAHYEEYHQCEKSTAFLLKERDNNARYFHCLASFHKRFIHNGSVEVDGVQRTKQNEVKESIVRFYEKHKIYILSLKIGDLMWKSFICFLLVRQAVDGWKEHLIKKKYWGLFMTWMEIQHRVHMVS